MYTEFLRIQIEVKNQKYHNDMASNTKAMRESDKKMTVSLGKLAFQQLKEGRLIFYEQDLKDSGIDVNKTHEYSGLCTEIFEEETGPYKDKTYCFVHLSIQEYLAALSVYFLYANNEENPFNQDMTKHTNADGGIKLSAVLRSAVDKALECQYGRLDLFLRFLFGIWLESEALSWLLAHKEGCPKQVTEMIKYLKEKISKSRSPERTINLFHCLNELHDDSLVKEIQSNLSNSSSNQKLSPDQCSALAYVLLMSEKEVDVLDLRMYNSTQAGYRRLLPVLKHSRKALLQVCDLTPALCAPVKDVLMSPTCLLRELDLGHNRKLGDKGCKQLCAGLLSPHCKLQTLGLGDCSLTQGCCDDLVSILRSQHSHLRELDLRGNDLLDSGVTALSAGLGDPICKLQKLGLSGCGVTEAGCQSLASALLSNPSHLRELDLSYNHPGDLGIKVLSARQEEPSCTLETLNVDHCGEGRMKQGMQKYVFSLTLDPSSVAPHVILSEGNRRAHRRKNTEGQHTPTVMGKEALTERYYWEVEWGSGSIELGVAYKAPTNGDGSLGRDDQSWAISANTEQIMAVHKNCFTHLISLHPLPKYRVGVYLDWPSGTLAFYNISSKGPVHLHTFHATFTQPLHAAFTLTMDVPMTLF
ncbi:hypothetical protein GJAV_G00065760 [Gymnothorax javanicus]|nr:hypothetical protein GJAV_G00065760 [Gymnothorax javanicus]